MKKENAHLNRSGYLFDGYSIYFRLEDDVLEDFVRTYADDANEIVEWSEDCHGKDTVFDCDKAWVKRLNDSVKALSPTLHFAVAIDKIDAMPRWYTNELVAYAKAILEENEMITVREKFKKSEVDFFKTIEEDNSIANIIEELINLKNENKYSTSRMEALFYFIHGAAPDAEELNEFIDRVAERYEVKGDV